MPSAPVIPYDRYKCSSPQQPCLLDPIPICSHCSYRLFLLQITSQHTSELRLSILGTVHSPPWTPLAGLHHTRSEAAIYQLQLADTPHSTCSRIPRLDHRQPSPFRSFTVRSHLHSNKKHPKTVRYQSSGSGSSVFKLSTCSSPEIFSSSNLPIDLESEPSQPLSLV